MTNKEKILRQAKALHNTCKRIYKETRCSDCPFSVPMGCNLYGHPIEWGDKLKTGK